ncbi:vitamin K epoxide reductase family protein [Dysgonomonas sp. ZJ709]|uniref:vitamin K epoxide reductase family protein n=1 Tax=Dysgonomonas sp. ZJ709 TaxID=2709797 RepID=UPI0013EC8B19|nr:vitamin K epoxide reductase family protein [Dysgonomonas sp. ZJ709]
MSNNNQLKNKEKNTFIFFLQQLDVKYTNAFSDKYYNEHPNKDTLLGLSRMLSEYGIKNTSVNIENKKAGIFVLDVPFMAYTNKDIIVVYQKTSDQISYVSNSKNISMPIDEFIEIWSGIVLIAEPDENSSEPDYKEHRRKELLRIGEKGMTSLVVAILIIIGFIQNKIYYNWSLIFSLLLNIIGLYISFLLVAKGLNIQNKNADKICSSIKNGNCNSVLDSSAAKLFGTYGWSEIGLSYFVSNLLIILFFPQLISYLAIVNILTLPYSFWSVWYQRFRVKQWCPLCLIVQIILWSVFVVNYSFNYIQVPSFKVIDILISVCIYIFPFLIIYTLISNINDQSQKHNTEQRSNSLKMENGVFAFLLHRQPQNIVDKSNSQLLFGNADANILVTILSNPHCMACAWMHKRVEALLPKMEDKICIQYIISPFKSSSETAAKSVIGAYLNNKEQVMGIYQDWFENGKYDTKNFIQKYNINIDDENINEELEKHKSWIEKAQITTTPTIFINGYKLPTYYSIEDLEFLIKFQFDTILNDKLIGQNIPQIEVYE